MNLSDVTHAVLRFEDGHRTQAQLEVISLTGGMLSLPKPAVRESRVKLMFVTPTGPVLGTAEMLNPVSWNQQPFRFVGLDGDDQKRLQESIQSSFGQVSKDQEWIDKYGLPSTTRTRLAGAFSVRAWRLLPWPCSLWGVRSTSSVSSTS